MPKRPFDLLFDKIIWPFIVVVFWINVAVVVTSILFGCTQQDNTIQLTACIDGWEIAELREKCLAPSDQYDGAACREVRVDMVCDDPATGSIGVLMIAPREEFDAGS